MGRNNYLFTLITDGECKVLGDKWSYEGSKKPKAMVVSESIKFEALKKKIVEKMNIDLKRYHLQLKYVAPIGGMLPPYEIINDGDLEAYKFLNTKSSKEGVWPIELYASVLKENKQVCFFELLPQCSTRREARFKRKDKISHDNEKANSVEN